MPECCLMIPPTPNTPVVMLTEPSKLSLHQSIGGGVQWLLGKLVKAYQGVCMPSLPVIPKNSDCDTDWRENWSKTKC